MKQLNWHGLILAVAFIVGWFVFAYGPVMGVVEHVSRPRFVATPDRATPDATFRNAVADPEGPPIYMKKVPFSNIMVFGPKGANGEIVPMLYQGQGFTGPVETYYDERGEVKWRMPKKGGRP